MKATFQAEVIEDRDATITLRLLTGFGDPIVMVPKDLVKLEDCEHPGAYHGRNNPCVHPECVAPAKILGSDPT